MIMSALRSKKYRSLSRNHVVIFITLALALIIGTYALLLHQARTDLYIESGGFRLTTWQFLVMIMQPIVTAIAWILIPLGLYIFFDQKRNSKIGLTLLIGGLIAAATLAL